MISTNDYNVQVPFYKSKENQREEWIASLNVTLMLHLDLRDDFNYTVQVWYNLTMINLEFNYTYKTSKINQRQADI